MCRSHFWVPKRKQNNHFRFRDPNARHLFISRCVWLLGEEAPKGPRKEEAQHMFRKSCSLANFSPLLGFQPTEIRGQRCVGAPFVPQATSTPETQSGVNHHPGTWLLTHPKCHRRLSENHNCCGVSKQEHNRAHIWCHRRLRLEMPWRIEAITWSRTHPLCHLNLRLNQTAAWLRTHPKHSRGLPLKIDVEHPVLGTSCTPSSRKPILCFHKLKKNDKNVVTLQSQQKRSGHKQLMQRPYRSGGFKKQFLLPEKTEPIDCL